MIETNKRSIPLMGKIDNAPTMPPAEPAADCPFGPKLQKYWNLLSPDERKMQLDVEGLYSLTVRSLALDIARTLQGDSVVDAFCGLGGNAIAFALMGKKVTAYELDPRRLEMARANAEMAGVLNQITFVEGSCLPALQSGAADAVFLDPPWGGPEYSKIEKFQLSYFSPEGGPMLESALKNYKYVAFKLPANFDFAELERFAANSWQLQHNWLNGKLLHITAFSQ